MFTQVNRLYRTILPTANQKLLKTIKKQVKEIIALEPEYAQLTDAELRGKTQHFKNQLMSGKTLDDILVEAFATVREVSHRVRQEKHYPVQLIGGIVLHKGMIAEMGTGEGKTLVATLPAYLNALAGKGVHVITVNDYLARRDAHAMGEIYEFLGLSVGCLASTKGNPKAAYMCDITYGTNHDFVFDYLRDNMVKNINQLVQRDYDFCIIDEVDNILIDEARTPCIISGEAMEASELCKYANYIIKQLKEEDYEKDEKNRTANFTENGLAHLEEIFRNEGLISENETLFDEQYVLLIHHLNQALKANLMFAQGVQYIVRDDEVLIVDESTGRIMEGRRFSDGLHQALEAKEGVDIKKENQTLATITYQKFFELYPKKSGMTGTAFTESEELSSVYGLNVVVIPPNKKSMRQILDDKIYRSLQEKIDFVVQTVKECNAKQQPILIGTSSVEKSELFSQALSEHNIKHEVLNAKNHAREADIIAQAGTLGAVTISTNMAGRGTDIKLGGTLKGKLKGRTADEHTLAQIESEIEEDARKIKKVGGLFVLGTERHESRRIDNQLLGRCGRQGDPGTALFTVSLEDQLMQIFGGKTLNKWLGKSEYGEVIEHPLVSRAISKAQKKVEAFHFDSRKNVLKYDAVINDQSKIVYAERKYFMTSALVMQNVTGIIDHLLDDIAQKFIQTRNNQEFIAHAHNDLNIEVQEHELLNCKTEEDVIKLIHERVDQQLVFQQTSLGKEYMEYICQDVCLSTLDMLWRQHLTKIENLRAGIGLRSYGQQDPLNEFKREAFEAFEGMLANFRQTVARCVMHHKPAEYNILKGSKADGDAFDIDPASSELANSKIDEVVSLIQQGNVEEAINKIAQLEQEAVLAGYSTLTENITVDYELNTQEEYVKDEGELSVQTASSANQKKVSEKGVQKQDHTSEQISKESVRKTRAQTASSKGQKKVSERGAQKRDAKKTGSKTASKPNGSRASVKRVSKQDVQKLGVSKAGAKTASKASSKKENKADDGVQKLRARKASAQQNKNDTTADQNRKKKVLNKNPKLVQDEK